jgi:NADPH:quinone reductase-like Zn-dependent oxidoreductase
VNCWSESGPARWISFTILLVLVKKPLADGRILLSDGAGCVIAVGDDVDEFKVAEDKARLRPVPLLRFRKVCH